MKHLMFFAVLLVSLPAIANIYYVDVNGDNSNNGSQSTPWATIPYAVTNATSIGDTIFINAGKYTLSTECDLAVGVSLMGAGNKTIINCTLTSESSYGFWLVSDKVNTSGNQSISHIRFTGNSVTAYGAIIVTARGNVSIHDCEFEDFDDCAVTFDGKAVWNNDLPTEWTISNKFHNNKVINCCKRQEGDWMSGALQLGAQEGMLIYSNYFRENKRGGAQCGYPIKYYAGGYNRGIKIYNNTIIKLPAIEDSYDWNFAIELWYWMGGIEIYNNYIEGSIDLDHIVKGKYAFGTKIHNNFFGYPSLPTSSGNWMNLNGGLYIEYACSDVFIYNNEFKNLETPIRFSPRNGDTYDGIHIYYNIFHQIGNDAGDEGCNLMNFAGNGYTINNLNILNNTIYAGSNGAQFGIIFNEQNFNNLTIQNNIFQGFGTNPIELNGNNKNKVSIENNIFYANGTNAVNLTGTPTNYTNKNNLTDNPNFKNPEEANFSVPDNSPVVDAGLDVGLSTDHYGTKIPYNSKVDIGMYEYNSLPFSNINSTENGDSFNITPNPTNDYCKVSINNSFERYTIQLFDLQGKMVYNKLNLIESEHTIHLENFVSGVYIVKIIINNTKTPLTDIVIKN